MEGSLPCSSPVTSNTIGMTVYVQPTVQLTPDTIIAGGSRLFLKPVVSGPVTSWQWSPPAWLSDPHLAGPLASPVETITYVLDVRTGDGCTASAKEKVIVFYDLLMPNAFTPNGDGRNDIFRIPPAITVSIRHFFVYDRWGAPVFVSENSSDGWDGRKDGQSQPAGTYIWVIEYYHPILKKFMMKRGIVELIR